MTRRNPRPSPWIPGPAGAAALLVVFGLGLRAEANPGGDPTPTDLPPPVVDVRDRGYTGADLPPVPRRDFEDVVPPVQGPLVVRVGGVGRLHKDRRESRPQGFLSGKSIYLSPGHGWTWTGTGWGTQRGNSLGIVEDFSNAETVIQFLIPYLWNASAHVVPVREVDMTTERVVLDDADGADHPDDGVVEELGDTTLFADSTLAGYGRFTPPVTGATNPFDLGGNRLLDTATDKTAWFRYTFEVPKDGFYDVYVSYSSYTARATDAHYVVRHPGGEAHFRVNQQHHGGTWVLLGRFCFPAGQDPERGAVELWNDSADAGSNVSSDAVRIGGGLGILDRGGGTSGFPRYLENSRYYCQYAGAPSSVWETTGDDGTDDVGSRSRFAAWVHEDGEDSVYLSWHSNAGGGQGTSIYIYWPNAHGYCDGTEATAGSADLADQVLAEIISDIHTVWDPDWTDRGRRCAWFGEVNPSNNGEMPAALLESAFHDLPEDVEDMKEAAFRRIQARATYQGIVRYFAQRDGVTPVFLPEPPTAPAARNVGVGEVEVSWGPPDPDAAGGDPPQSYRLYQGPNGLAFDEGTDVGDVTRVVLDDLLEGEVRFFRVAAVNAGGESLPSPVVGVMASPSGHAPLLIVDGFDREDAGLLWAQDTGTSLGTVDRMVLRRMRDSAVVRRHGPEAAAHQIPFDSAHHRAALALTLEDYEVVDYVAGRGVSATRSLTSEMRDRLSAYATAGGNLLVTGSHVASQGVAGDAADQDFLGLDLWTEGSAGTGGRDLTPSTGEILDGVGAFELHDGDDHAGARGYDVGDPDALTPGADAVGLADYGGGGVAALRSPPPPGAAVLLAFPLEGVVDDGQRAEIMARILDFFDVDPQTAPDAGVVVDAGDSVDASPTCRDCPCDQGCGCASAGAGEGVGGGLLGLWLVLWLFGARRRRAR